MDDAEVYVGAPEKIADELRPVVDGRLPPRHFGRRRWRHNDAETLERLPEIRSDCMTMKVRRPAVVQQAGLAGMA